MIFLSFQVRIGALSAADHDNGANPLCGTTTKEQRAKSSTIKLDCPEEGLVGNLVVIRRIDDPELSNLEWDLNEFRLTGNFFIIIIIISSPCPTMQMMI